MTNSTKSRIIQCLRKGNSKKRFLDTTDVAAELMRTPGLELYAEASRGDVNLQDQVRRGDVTPVDDSPLTPPTRDLDTIHEADDEDNYNIQEHYDELMSDYVFETNDIEEGAHMFSKTFSMTIMPENTVLFTSAEYNDSRRRPNRGRLHFYRSMQRRDRHKLHRDRRGRY